MLVPLSLRGAQQRSNLVSDKGGGLLRPARKDKLLINPFADLPILMPTIPETLNLALQHHRAGRLQEAEVLYLQILQAQPDHPDALHLLGLVSHHAGKHADAVLLISKAIALNPSAPAFHLNLGEAYRVQGRWEEAVGSYRRAISLKPDYVEAHYNLGVAFQEQGELDEAIGHYRKALVFNPGYAGALNGLGVALANQGKVSEGAECLQQAVMLQPAFAEAHHNLGGVLVEQDKLEEALGCFRKALVISPDYVEAENEVLRLSQELCEWSCLENLWGRQRQFIHTKPSARVLPWTFLSVPSTAAEQLVCAGNWAFNHFAPLARRRAKLGFRFARAPKTRLRVGYVSRDYFEHATAYLIAELFELHDRGRFEVFAYSYGPDDGGTMRARIARACDRFADITAASIEDAARRIYEDGIDILVDLKGYTAWARPQIAALRPAPIQVNYLGYPGTMGADFMDYIITDRFITPPDQEPYFTEKLVYLPDCYQVNDRQRRIADRTPTRRECGLPESGFVFCCLNNTYKITPAMFGVWTRLLKEVPGSVLWLLEANAEAAANLRREASHRGADPDRLVFAPRVTLGHHLARLRVADLFLDTLPVSGHTTASDALWAGLPVLTCAGETFASRVAGSLLTAVGLPDLITYSLANYEARALGLARNPTELDGLRKRLAENRLTAPLFDSERYTRHLERAYQMMWETYLRGEAPRRIEVPAMRTNGDDR
jgi:predicted O-linked N-acetylglucosamine transferase (SPINDLY family)